MNDLTVVIPFYNGHEYLSSLLSGIPDDLPVVIVDDHSESPLRRGDLPDRDNIWLDRPKTKGYFTGAVNHGAAMCPDSDVLVLNQDVEFDGTGWLDVIDENRMRYALIGERIAGEHPAHKHGYVHGTFMFMRRDALAQAGDMDAELFPLWGSTCDWQLRIARQGYEALPLPNVPDFRHQRKRGQRYGTAIQQVLDEGGDRGLFIRTPPLVSVMMASHNYGRFLPDAVNSLIGGETCLGYMEPQTLQAFEIIIVEDASTDDESRNIALSLANKWQGIRVIEVAPRPDGSANGLPACLNVAAAHANGRYMAVMGADDMMEADRLRRMYVTAVANPSNYVYDDVQIVVDGERSHEWDLGEYNWSTLPEKNHVHAGIMFSRAAYEAAGGYPSQMAHGREDWAFNVGLGLAGYHGVKTGNADYLYRRDGHNRSMRNTTPDQIALFRQDIMSIYPDAYGRSMPTAVNGQAVLQYVGRNHGTMPWYTASGKRYDAGLDSPLIVVDGNEVPELLSLQERGDGSVFRRYSRPVTHDVQVVADSYKEN